MGISINLESTFKELENDISRLAQSEFSKITTQAVNKTITTTRTHASKIFRAKIKLKAGLFSKKYTRIFKAKRGAFSGYIELSNKPLRLINFMKNTSSTPQKGTLRNSRKAPLVPYRKGKSTRIKGGFIMKGRSGNVHIFKRSLHGGKTYLVPQAAPSISETFNRASMVKPLQVFAQFQLKKQFAVALNYHFKKVAIRNRGWA